MSRIVRFLWLPLVLSVSPALLSSCLPSRPASVRRDVPRPEIPKTPCPGEFAWPRWQDLFEQFASNRQYMHKYLFNGDEVWPKNIDFCARARNSLLDLANGPGTSLELGLAGSAWESLIYTVAFTNAFERFADPVTGSDWLYVWPVVSDLYVADVGRLLNVLEQPEKISELPRHLVLPKMLAQTAREDWPSADAADLQKAWNRRMLGALVRKLTRQAATMDAPYAGYDFKRGTERTRFYRQLDGLPRDRRHTLLRDFCAHLVRTAAARNLLFPAERVRNEMKRLVYFTLPGFPEPVGPGIVRILATEKTSPELISAVARLDYLTTGKWEGSRPLPEGWAADRETWVALRQELVKWQTRVSQIAASASLKRVIYAQMEKNPVVLSGNVFFATSHLEESSTGYTHVGLVLNLPSRPGQPWLFDRVQAFFYANPVRDLKKSALVELVAPSASVVARPRRYAALPYRVHSPIKFASGASDMITFFNMVTDWKPRLPAGYTLGPEFLWGAIHLIPHLPQNQAMLRRFQYLRNIGQYSYIDYLNLRPLAGQDVHLIARCPK